MFNLKLPSKKEINLAFASFSKKEGIFFYSLVVVLCVSTLLILQSINKSFMVTVPMKGGETSIGIVGVPRFINPVLANSNSDISLTSLIYSGLMRKNRNGELIPDLASKYEMSDNGLEYTFTLKENLSFHDGEPLSADDVLFTVSKIKEEVIKSPQKIYWDGVSIEKIDKKTIKFKLKQPYASFLDNTTLGIMPAQLWDDTPLELNTANTNPVGSGPYMIDSAVKQTSGVIDSYELVPFKKFILGEPYIEKVHLHFYQNEEDLIQALLKGEVQEIGLITPANAENLKEKNYQIESATLPRVFGLFFNHNQNQLFTDKAVIGAINQAIDRKRIIREVFLGYGTSIDSPIPLHIMDYQKVSEAETMPRQDLLERTQNDLAKAGWEKNEDGWLEKTTTQNKKKTTTPLEFSISTGNTPELAKSATLIKEDLEALGMKVDVKTFEVGNLNQSVIRPRKYDVLLFGQIINRESDLFAFWHSSQRNDPGLNVAMYTNAKVDKILEEAFVTLDQKQRIEKYAQFEQEIAKDSGAVFLFSPNFIYVMSKDTKNSEVERLTMPTDRYLNIYSWYIETQNVWKFIAKNNNN